MVRPQAPTRSPSTSPVESSVPDERHVPIMPHSPSYASALVPPPISEPITPLVSPVTEETSTPPSSVQTPEGLPVPPPSGNKHVVVPDPQPGSANIPVPDPQPDKPINAPSQAPSEPITPPPLVESTSAPVEPLITPSITTSTTEPVTNPPPPTTNPLTEPVTSSESSSEPIVVPIEPLETQSSTLAAEAISADPMDLPVPSPVELETSPFPISIPDPVVSVMEESTVSPSGSASNVVLSNEMPSKTPPVVIPSLIDQVEVFPPKTHVGKFIIRYISLTTIFLLNLLAD